MKEKIRCPKCKSKKIFISKYVLKNSHISESNQKECKCLNCGYGFSKEETDKYGFTPTVKSSKFTNNLNESVRFVELTKIDWDE